MKKIILSIVLVGIATLVFASCTSIAGDSSSSELNTVHMTNSTFGKTSVTIAKGSNLTLLSDTSQAHIIDNGTWGSDGVPHPKVEPGTPVIKDAQFLDTTPQSFGPFTTPGTYHLYCTIHANMNLTVIVK